MPAPTVQSERTHYLIIQSLATNNDFNAVKYLYDRLNIIDSKVSSLLRINAILFSAMAIFVSQFFKEPAAGAAAQVAAPVFSGPDEVLLVLGYVFIILSTVAGFFIFRLQFDNVTEVPDRLEARVALACRIDECKSAGRCSLAFPCEVAAIKNQSVAAKAAGAPMRRIEDYEQTFFEITLRRQEVLKWSYRLTIGGGVVFLLLVARLIGPHLVFVQHVLAYIQALVP